MNAIRRMLPLALIAGMAVSQGLAQSPSSERRLLDEALREREVATQKAEVELRSAIQKATNASSADALAILKQALSVIEANKILPEARRESMARMLKDRIRIAELEPRKPGATSEKPAVPAVPASVNRNEVDEKRKADLMQQETERKAVQSAVVAIDKLIGQRQFEAAERQARELAATYPNNTAAKVMGQKSFINARIREAKDLLNEQERRIAAAMQDVTKSSMPANGDLEFDKKRWTEISKYRKTDKLTEKERAILQSLSKMVRPDWKGSRFDDVVEYLATLTGQTIFVDKKALEDAQIGTDAAVNFVAPREVSVRTALRKIFGDLGLAYVIRDEMIYVTTAQRAKDMMTTRTYYLGDLVAGTAPNLPIFLQAQQEGQIVDMIVGMIKRSVDPMSWEGEGGKASLHYDPVTKALIVRQSAEVHMLLRNSLGR